MRCPSCEFSNPDGFRYCGACGCSLLAAEPERRQLTVMFCDLVGSAALSERLDPESLRDVIGRYREICTRAVSGFGGTVAQFYGDGLEVYFGYPQAHEDDPLRAVCAGMEMVTALRSVWGAPGQDSLQMRVGIHTGLVVVGELGQGSSRDPMPSMGAAPNLAARLQSLASPSSIVISEETLRLCKGGVQVEPLGRHSLKGFSMPREVFRVLSVDGLGPRPQSEAMSSTPLVGRDLELGALEAEWDACERGQSRTALVSGDAGIGKTRLVNALAFEVCARGGSVLVGQCSALYQSTAFYPLASLALTRLGLDPEDPVTSDELAEVLSATLPERLAARLAPLLLSYRTSSAGEATDGAGRAAPDAGDRCAERRHDAGDENVDESGLSELHDALYDLLARCPGNSPTLLVVEDLHWVDPSSRELLRRFARESHDAPLLCVFTARSFADMDFEAGGHTMRLALDGLERDGVRELTRSLTGAGRVSDEALDELCNRSDGIPLFVEEMVGTLQVEKRLVLREDLLCLVQRASLLPLPSSLRDLLTARLDGLGDLKSLAQLASVAGRDFRLGLLAAVAGRDPEAVRCDLERLVEAGVLVRPLGKSAPLFGFKHALIQEAAYETLLVSRRQTLHVQVAEVMLSHFPELARRQPEVLAQHFAAAGVPARAVPFWAQAGELALDRGAQQEATTHFSRALTQLLLEDESSARDRRELALQLRLAAALTAGRGHADPEVESSYARANHLCARLGEAEDLQHASFQAHSGLQSVYYLRGPMEQALEQARELEQLAQSTCDPALSAQALRRTGLAQFALGRFRDARDLLMRSADAATAQRDETADEARLLTRIDLAWTDWFLGHTARARAGSEAAVAAARRGPSHGIQAFAYCVSAAIHQCRDEPGIARRLADAASQLARQRSLAYWGAWARILYGYAVAARGDSNVGMQAMVAGLEAYRASGATLLVPHGLALLAGARHRAGQPESALQLCREGLAVSTTGGAHFYDVELLRMEAVLELELGESASATEARLWSAIELARDQGAILLEMRVALEFARLTRSVEVLHQVRDRLRKVNDAA